MVKPRLIYSGAGVYEPHITPDGTVWRRNIDGTPFVGASVENIRSVRTWAEIVRVEIPKGDRYEHNSISGYPAG